MPWAEPLRADCNRCAALCCMAAHFDQGPDFAHTKPSQTPCPHLEGQRCAIHADLLPKGYRGCTVFDCAGAGQHTTQLFEQTWQDDPALIPVMAKTYAILLRLHQAAALLETARALPLPNDKLAEIDRLMSDIFPTPNRNPEQLSAAMADQIEARTTQFLRTLAPYVRP